LRFQYCPHVIAANGKDLIMFQIKIAAILMTPLIFLCAIATAQEQQSDGLAKNSTSSDIKSQKKIPPPLTAHPNEDFYGPYVPYIAPSQKTGTPQGKAAATVPTGCITQNEQTPSPLTFQTQPNDVYGPYVPYTGPLLKMASVKCEVAAAPAIGTSDSHPTLSSPLHPNASTTQKQQPDGIATMSSPVNLLQPAGAAVAFEASPAPSTGDPGGGYVRWVPPPPILDERREVRPFRSVAIGFKADTLGAGIELATPISQTFNLRSSINFLSFDDPFSIDGVNYTARLHLKSSETILDWFPGNRRFHISPGILYGKNSMSAPASVGPGQTFVLGTQQFINSVDDPVSGSSSVVFPRKFAPMLLLGLGNIIPRTGRHLSIPFEFGVAYTGAPKIQVALDGTACTTKGCVDFGSNAEAQADLKQEVNNLNEDLKRYPVYPILSLGVAYHF
jgi:hypothetical protein